MELFWQEQRSGLLRLVLRSDSGEEVDVGRIRQTRRGYDAMASTLGYDPGRAVKGLESFEEARQFVESFHPWELFGGHPDMEVEPEVRSASA